MPQVVRLQKGSSGFPNVNYRHIDGQEFPALITGSSAMAVPAAPTITVVGAAGTTTYSYRVTAVTPNGETTVSAAGSTATGNAALSGANFNRVSWAAVAGASMYRVYGRSGTELLMATISVTAIGGATKVGGGTINGTGAGDGFEDQGTITPSGAQPASNTARRYNIRVSALKAAGASEMVKSNVGIISQRYQTGGLVVGR